MRRYILNSANFTYEPFFDSRNELGFSGQLLIATNKKTQKKLLVKHAFISDVMNEFVAAYIAEHLYLGNPKAYLFRPSPSSPFSCGYAVGIEFMEGLRSLNYDTITDHQATDFIHQYALNCICAQTDNFQFGIWNNRVVSYDFSECFYVSDLTIKIHYAYIRDQFSLSFDSFKSHCLFNPKYALDRLKWGDDKLSEVERIYYDGLLPLLDINEDELFYIMTELFPEDIVNYYYARLFYMKEQLSYAMAAIAIK